MPARGPGEESSRAQSRDVGGGAIEIATKVVVLDQYVNVPSYERALT